MWIDPGDPSHIVVGDDGGVSETWDKGGNWMVLNSIAISQVYDVSFDFAVPYNVCGGLQDNGAWCGPSRRKSGSITNSMWYTVDGGDGFYTAQDPTDSHIVYAESQGGDIVRVNTATGESVNLAKPSARTQIAPATRHPGAAARRFGHGEDQCREEADCRGPGDDRQGLGRLRPAVQLGDAVPPVAPQSSGALRRRQPRAQVGAAGRRPVPDLARPELQRHHEGARSARGPPAASPTTQPAPRPTRRWCRWPNRTCGRGCSTRGPTTAAPG